MKKSAKERLAQEEKRRSSIPEGGVPAEGDALKAWHKALRKKPTRNE